MQKKPVLDKGIKNLIRILDQSLTKAAAYAYTSCCAASDHIVRGLVQYTASYWPKVAFAASLESSMQWIP
jgi:hypothetical protein